MGEIRQILKEKKDFYLFSKVILAFQKWGISLHCVTTMFWQYIYSNVLYMYVRIRKYIWCWKRLNSSRYFMSLSLVIFWKFPSFPSNSHVGGICYFFFYNSPKLLSCFFFKQNQLKFSYDRVQTFLLTGIYVRDGFHENKSEWMDFLL